MTPAAKRTPCNLIPLLERCEMCDGIGGAYLENGGGGKHYPLEYDWETCPRCEGSGREPVVTETDE